MLKHSLLIGAAVAAMATGTAQANLLLYEGFDYATTTPVGQSGGAGWGSGSWTVASASSSYAISLQNQLAFSDYPVYGKTAEIFNNNNGGGAPAILARQLGASVSAGTPFYTSFLVYQTKGYGNSSPASTYVGIGATSTGSLKLSETTRTMWGPSTPANAALGYGGTNGSANGVVADNTTYLVIARFANTGDNTQTASMWILNAANYDAAKVGGLTDAKLDQFNQAKLTATSAGATIASTDYLQIYDTTNWGYQNTTRIDELRIMTSLADITATSVPEPVAPIAALLAGSIALVRRRRA